MRAITAWAACGRACALPAVLAVLLGATVSCEGTGGVTTDRGTATRSYALPASAPAQERRVALVIGNGAYAGVGQLTNPPGDARRMAEMLRRDLGFEVADPLINAGLSAMDAVLDRFRQAADGAGIALFFYAGHGMENDGRNWLLPTDVRLEQERDVPRQTLPLDQVLLAMRGARVKLVLLDACRDNPFTERMLRFDGARGVPVRGLEPVFSPEGGTVIGFAAAPRQTAADGSGPDSPFTTALLQLLPTATDDIRVVLGDVSDAVQRATGGRQVPWTNFNLSGRVVLRAVQVAPLPASARPEGTVAVVVPPPVSLPAPVPPPPPAGGYPVPVGQSFRDCPDCPEMVVIPAGRFLMGSPASEPGRGGDEGPQHEVTLRAPLAVGKYDVTFAEWDACVAAGGCGGYRPSDAGWGRGRRPAINVFWDDSQAYTRWLSRRTGRGYRLLTEAEWEYAARAGTTSPFYTGAQIRPDQAQYDWTFSYAGSPTRPSRPMGTASVGSFPPNVFGLYDMAGNVSQWVSDCYRDNYAGTPSDASESFMSNNCSSHILRGGFWASSPEGLRTAYRFWVGTDYRKADDDFGFRLARTPAP